jgi:signal transduction histidine kinase
MQAHPLSSPAARNLNPSGSTSSIAGGPGLAHDAGNLLGALGLYCDLLNLPGVLRPEHLHYARELRLLSQRSGALINRLLDGDNAAVDSIPCRPPPPRGPAAIVREFAPLLRALAAPAATVSMAVAPGLPELPFAPEVLERILVNLTRNAAAALHAHFPIDAPDSPCDGRIRISLGGNATRLRLTVTDNGPGMRPATAAAFLNPEPLKQGARRGLGHRVVDDLLQSTGGKLSIKVNPGYGTSLQMEWPITPASAACHPIARRTLRAGKALSC